MKKQVAWSDPPVFTVHLLSLWTQANAAIYRPRNIQFCTKQNHYQKYNCSKVNLLYVFHRSRYGFVTYQRARDAWTAVEAANTFPQYDVGFGGRRAFCRQSYADLGEL